MIYKYISLSYIKKIINYTKSSLWKFSCDSGGKGYSIVTAVALVAAVVWVQSLAWPGNFHTQEGTAKKKKKSCFPKVMSY